MFGYINVNRKELSKENIKEYQAYYCGLCQQLKCEGGMKAQALLNYDMTFLIILLTGLYELEPQEKNFVCAVHPTKKQLAYVNEATAYAAAMDIVLSYHNLMDDYRDNGNIPKKALASTLRKDYERISAKYPSKVLAVENYMKQLAQAEKSKETNVDIISGYTGEMLSQLFAWKEEDIWNKDLKNLGFYMGKFIYLLDAYEDLDKDLKTGNYNPLRYMKEENTEEYETFCRLTLTTLMAECAKSFERMPILMHADIIRNILYSGVWTKYEYLQIKTGKKKVKEEQQND